MNLQTFAEQHRVHTRRDSCGDTIIPGKHFQPDMPKRVEYRSHVYDGFSGDRLGLCLLLATKKRWTYARRKLEAAGFTIKQDGEAEGCAIFDPANLDQVRLAFKLAGIHPRRVRNLSDEQRQAIGQRLLSFRGNVTKTI